jgi:hypothetical protein
MSVPEIKSVKCEGTGKPEVAMCVVPLMDRRVYWNETRTCVAASFELGGKPHGTSAATGDVDVSLAI